MYSKRHTLASRSMRISQTGESQKSNIQLLKKNSNQFIGIKKKTLLSDVTVLTVVGVYVSYGHM